MSIIFPPVHLYPEIYNTDRNIFILWGGTHTWDNATGEWIFDNTCYIQWMSSRYKGTAQFNQVLPQTVVLTAGQVAYVILDLDTDGTVLTVQVVDGASLPKGDNIVVIGIRCSNLPNDPLLLRNGVYIPSQSAFSTAGVRTQYVGNYTGVTWNVNHNLGSEDVFIELKDNSTPNKRIFPQTIEYIDDNNITVTYNESVTGKVIILKGVV